MSNEPQPITPERAIQLLDEPSTVDIWSIGHALDRDGPPLRGNVAAALMADILQVGETEPWPRSTRDLEVDQQLFRPFCIVPKDNRAMRSFLPEDLQAETEEPLRAFAAGSSSPTVQVRIYEVLWARFEKHEDALAGINARFAAAKLYDPDENWPDLVRNLGRLATLILRLNAKDRTSALVDALDHAAGQLTQCSRPFSFPVLADMASNTLLAKRPGREAFTTARGKQWADLLGKVADKYKGDPHHGHDALFMLQAWHMRWGNDAERTATQRRVVEHLIDAAEAADPIIAPSHLQSALQHALDFGISDLAERCRAALSRGIQGATRFFQRISGPLEAPKEVVEQLDAILVGAHSLATAVRQLVVLPGMLEIDLQRFRDAARQQLGESPLLGLMPSTHYHPDGKVIFRSNDFEGNVERWTRTLIGFHLVQVEAVLQHFLAQAISRLDKGTLLNALAAWPHLVPNRVALLSVAAERFSARDWISSGVIATIVYEAILRDLLRACGYSAMKTERGGVQMDEALNSLLRNPIVRQMLGDQHCDLVEYVLCDPALGWNLRNEVAHGTIRPDELTPTRVLLVWLLIIRVTCLVSSPENTGPEAPSNDGAPDTEE